MENTLTRMVREEVTFKPKKEIKKEQPDSHRGPKKKKKKLRWIPASYLNQDKLPVDHRP